MVSELEARVHHRQTGEGRREAPQGRQLAEILFPFKQGYRKICDDRAKLAHLASRRISTTAYQTILYQEKMDDLRIHMEEMESEIASALYLSLDDLVEECLALSIGLCLERSRTKGIELPDQPKTTAEVRSILYRMYRGGSFYPLIFIRDLESAFFKILGRKISARGMRGQEIAARARVLVLRLRFDLDESMRRRLEGHELMEFIGNIRWIWRRGKVVRRPAYAPRDRIDEAKRVAGILDQAVRRRQIALRETAKRHIV